MALRCNGSVSRSRAIRRQMSLRASRLPRSDFMRGEVYTIFEPGVITFAIPFHSATQYLPRALDSVRAQTDARWRCLVVDESGGAEELVRGDPRIQYFRNPKPLGMAA